MRVARQPDEDVGVSMGCGLGRQVVGVSDQQDSRNRGQSRTAHFTGVTRNILALLLVTLVMQLTRQPSCSIMTSKIQLAACSYPDIQIRQIAIVVRLDQLPRLPFMPTPSCHPSQALAELVAKIVHQADAIHPDHSHSAERLQREDRLDELVEYATEMLTSCVQPCPFHRLH